MATTPATPANVPSQPLGQPALRPAKTPAASAEKADPFSVTSSQAPAATPAGKVQISAAGLAALQESRETPAQTATEARRGDRAAKVIVAREQAHLAAYKATAK